MKPITNPIPQRDIVVIVDGIPPFVPHGELAKRLLQLGDRLMREQVTGTTFLQPPEAPAQIRDR